MSASVKSSLAKVSSVKEVRYCSPNIVMMSGVGSGVGLSVGLGVGLRLGSGGWDDSMSGGGASAPESHDDKETAKARMTKEKIQILLRIANPPMMFCFAAQKASPPGAPAPT